MASECSFWDLNSTQMLFSPAPSFVRLLICLTEKPLSTLGKLTYYNYWQTVVIEYFIDHDDDEKICLRGKNFECSVAAIVSNVFVFFGITDICSVTGLTPEDALT